MTAPNKDSAWRRGSPPETETDDLKDHYLQAYEWMTKDGDWDGAHQATCAYCRLIGVMPPTETSQSGIVTATTTKTTATFTPLEAAAPAPLQRRKEIVQAVTMCERTDNLAMARAAKLEFYRSLGLGQGNVLYTGADASKDDHQGQEPHLEGSCSSHHQDDVPRANRTVRPMPGSRSFFTTSAAVTAGQHPHVEGSCSSVPPARTVRPMPKVRSSRTTAVAASVVAPARTNGHDDNANCKPPITQAVDRRDSSRDDEDISPAWSSEGTMTEPPMDHLDVGTQPCLDIEDEDDSEKGVRLAPSASSSFTAVPPKGRVMRMAAAAAKRRFVPIFAQEAADEMEERKRQRKFESTAGGTAGGTAAAQFSRKEQPLVACQSNQSNTYMDGRLEQPIGRTRTIQDGEPRPEHGTNLSSAVLLAPRRDPKDGRGGDKDAPIILEVEVDDVVLGNQGHTPPNPTYQNRLKDCMGRNRDADLKQIRWKVFLEVRKSGGRFLNADPDCQFWVEASKEEALSMIKVDLHNLLRAGRVLHLSGLSQGQHNTAKKATPRKVENRSRTLPWQGVEIPKHLDSKALSMCVIYRRGHFPINAKFLDRCANRQYEELIQQSVSNAVRTGVTTGNPTVNRVLALIGEKQLAFQKWDDRANRWETPTSKQIRNKVLDAVKNRLLKILAQERDEDHNSLSGDISSSEDSDQDY